jgi:RNA methyltransferase, TrmH family
MHDTHNKSTVISSRDNKKLKALKKIVSSDGIKKTGLTLVAGKKIVREIAALYPQLCRCLIVHDGCMKNQRETASMIEEFSRRDSLLILKRSLFNDLDIFQTACPLLEVAVPDIPVWDSRLPEKGCTLLIPFQDPLNVGTVVRSAAAFGVTHIVLLQEAAHPFHPRCIRASGGAVFKVAFSRGPSLRHIFEKISHILPYAVTLDMHGIPIQQFSFPEKFLLLPGIEGQGLPAVLKKNAVAIPISPAIESLNGAIATSIALFYFHMKAQPLQQ